MLIELKKHDDRYQKVSISFGSDVTMENFCDISARNQFALYETLNFQCEAKVWRARPILVVQL